MTDETTEALDTNGRRSKIGLLKLVRLTLAESNPPGLGCGETGEQLRWKLDSQPRRGVIVL